jgi:hypothetical protein
MTAATDKTAEEFAEGYAIRSGVTVEWLREHGREVRPCDCDAPECEGWQMAHLEDERVNKFRRKDHTPPNRCAVSGCAELEEAYGFSDRQLPLCRPHAKAKTLVQVYYAKHGAILGDGDIVAVQRIECWSQKDYDAMFKREAVPA